MLEKKIPAGMTVGGLRRCLIPRPEESKSFCFFFFRKRSAFFLAKGVDGRLKGDGVGVLAACDH
jgi:hypothetical protein